MYDELPCDISEYFECLNDNASCVDGVVDVSEWVDCAELVECGDVSGQLTDSDASAGSDSTGNDDDGDGGEESDTADESQDSGDEDEAGEDDAGDDDSGQDDHTQLGSCGISFEGVADADSIRGSLVYWIISDRGQGTPVCQVGAKVEASSVSDAECYFGGTRCDWAHDLVVSSPTIELDVEGACEHSEAGWHADKLAELDGMQLTWGHAPSAGGHQNAVLELGSDGVWNAIGFGAWESNTGELVFSHTQGLCGFSR